MKRKLFLLMTILLMITSGSYGQNHLNMPEALTYHAKSERYFVANYNGTIVRNEKDGHGSLTESGQELRPVVFGRLSSGDINGDGFADLIISSVRQNDEIWINDKKGKFTKSKIDFLNNSSRHTTYLTDLNNDNKSDVIIADFFGGANQLWLNERGDD